MGGQSIQVQETKYIFCDSVICSHLGAGGRTCSQVAMQRCYMCSGIAERALSLAGLQCTQVT